MLLSRFALPAMSVLAMTAASGAHAACVENPTNSYQCSATQIDGLEDNSDDVSVTVLSGATVENNGGPNGGDALRVRGNGTQVTIQTGPGGDGVLDASGDGVDSGDNGFGLTVFNDGQILAQKRGVNADDEDDVTVINGGTIDAQDDGIRLGNGVNALFVNAGTLKSGDEGFEAGDNAFVQNGPGALIQATEDAVQIGDDGTILNEGTIESTDIDRSNGTRAGSGGDGIDLDSGAIVNTGVIKALDGSGIDFDASPVLQSTIYNSGEITGRVGIEVELGGADPANTADQIIFTDGKITGTDGVAIELGEGQDLVAVFDDLSALGAAAGVPIPLGSAAPAEINGLTNLGAGDDQLAFVNATGGGMIYDAVIGDIFDGGADIDTALFSADISELISSTGTPASLELLFGNGTDTKTLTLNNFEFLVFGVDPLTGFGGALFEIRADGSLAPVPLPAGIVLLGGALVALRGLRRKG